ncbi:MAG: hypothetical protein Alis3KO_41150 [Aliiglaciecola sp.]|uniref:hypothetical protein n=1 Tax=Aliiglaciecola sp. M165 TaxID=2593649 RepID=UPI00117C3696|nr:hypothetical protein [Aliiglaciecola sp. M165]TRY28669.1 hypothetical protein FM019_20630 [Aliiglaciecola sp. M165]
MDELTIGLVVMIIAGSLPCILVGYLIAVKQKRGLIAGWDESKVSNPEAYAKLLGYSVLLLGVLIALVSFIWYFGLIDEMGVAVALLLVSLVPVPFVFVANKKYKSHVS